LKKIVKRVIITYYTLDKLRGSAVKRGDKLLTNDNINDIKNKIVEKFHPEKIYLFGSYANGTATEESDLDIAVILNNSINKLDNIRGIRNLLRDINNPIDIIVYNNNEFNDKVKKKYSFETTIVNDGILMYE